MTLETAPRPYATAAQAFIAGMRICAPIVIAVMPFALLFGTVAVQSGLSVWQATVMSTTIYGGASQLVGLELFGQRISPWLVVSAILAVNFRHVLYSAAFGRLVPHWKGWQKALGFFVLTDPQFAESEREHEKGSPLSFAWYMGLGIMLWASWCVGSFAGAYFGQMLPDTHAYGIDFLLPIYFLGLLMGFRRRAMFLPVVASSALASMVAYHFIGSPWHVSLGALAGIVVAALLPPRKAEA
ncbi:MAG: AzlC family ABC transporter permease [Methylobacterium mesophilicum]|nr:AzlC family ABC transporter permease [Methylobacterium mesophilicum]